LSHSGSPFDRVRSYHRGPAKAHLLRSLNSCLRYPAWLGISVQGDRASQVGGDATACRKERMVGAKGSAFREGLTLCGLLHCGARILRPVSRLSRSGSLAARDLQEIDRLPDRRKLSYPRVDRRRGPGQEHFLELSDSRAVESV